MVGMTGFEPATPSSQARCATKLRYIPKFYLTVNVVDAAWYFIPFVSRYAQNVRYIPKFYLTVNVVDAAWYFIPFVSRFAQNVRYIPKLYLTIKKGTVTCLSPRLSALLTSHFTHQSPRLAHLSAVALKFALLGCATSRKNI